MSSLTDSLTYPFLSAVGTDLLVSVSTAPLISIPELRIELSMDDGGPTYYKYGIITFDIIAGVSITPPVTPVTNSIEMNFAPFFKY